MIHWDYFTANVVLLCDDKINLVKTRCQVRDLFFKCLRRYSHVMCTVFLVIQYYHVVNYSMVQLRLMKL